MAHLTFADRLCLEKMLKQKITKRLIASTVGVSEFTIYAELKRGRYTHMNSDLTTEERYSPDIAHDKYRENLKAKGPGLKIGNDFDYANRLEYLISQKKYSPASALAVTAKEGYKTTICEWTLYKYIEKGVFLSLSNDDLPQKSKRTKTYKKVKRAARPPAGTSIEKRPESVNDRSEFGHWEMDTVESRKGKKECLLVLTGRQTRNEIIRKIPNQKPESVVLELNKLEKRYGKELFREIFKSLSVDNGTEFSDCAGMERSMFGGKRTKVYYCHPYSAYERGSNENANKLIRRWYPKGTDFSRISKKRVREVEEWINDYPRGIFGYHSSNEIWNAKTE